MVECILPQVRNIATINVFGMIRDMIPCVRHALVGTGRVGDVAFQFFTYWGEWLSETTGARSAFGHIRRTMQPSQGVLEDIENIIRITDMPANSMVIHIAYAVLRRIPSTVLLFVSDMITSVMPHGIKRIRRLPGVLLNSAEYVLTSTEVLIIKGLICVIMDVICDICR